MNAGFTGIKGCCASPPGGESNPESSWDPGYSLLEVLMAIFVMVVGTLSVLTLFAQALVVMSLAEEELIAKQKARETLESIYTARNTQQITFDLIQNAPSGVFLTGYQPLRVPNPDTGVGDGLVGTADDGDVETLTDPGPDGQLGTADDISRTLDNFERRILIEPVLQPDSTPYPNLRKITVTVRYTTQQGLQRSYQLESYISRFR